MEKTSWIDRVKNEVLHRAKVDRHNVQTIKGRKTNWNSHILCMNCLVKHVMEDDIEGKLEVMGR